MVALTSRILEPELMDEVEQAEAYAAADFSEPHENFVTLFAETFPRLPLSGPVLDLGCGPGDVMFRFARRFQQATIVGVDGSSAMLRCGEMALRDEPALAPRIRFVQAYLPSDQVPTFDYRAIISNSLLHHLPEPRILWQSLRRYATPETAIFVMDLMRPAREEEAVALTDRHAAFAPPVLRRDFYNSLRAAFTVAEIERELRTEGFSGLGVAPVSDRHFVISGHLVG